MNSEWKRTRLLGGTLGVLVLGILATGCAQQHVSLEFDQRLRAGVDALRDGDLDSAEQHIEAAWAKAESYEQQRQVHSLDQLCDGARSMMDGDVAQARRQWAAIRDPHLNHEVRVQARAVMGIEVPMVATDMQEEAAE
jgi:hypothetical protein